MRRASRERGGAAIAEALRERREEIEEATLIRVFAVSEPSPRSGPEYVEGLRAAVSAGVQYGLEGIERGERSASPVPEILLAQARLAARSGVSLDTVLRRYFAGHVLLEDFMVQEAERALDGPALKRLLRSQAAIADGLLAAVSKSYTEEVESHRQSAERRRAERVERLLAGELLDTRELAYDFAGWHIGLLARGPGAEKVVAAIGRTIECRTLLVPREEATLWVWLGSKRRPDLEQVEGLASTEPSVDVHLAIGEPGEGVAGWRLTHRQARAGLSIAVRGGERMVRYRNVALLAAALHDELLRVSLRDLYLVPLAAERDGAVLLQTLRAYFAAERNVSLTATGVEADRKTITSRLQRVEQLLGRPIVTCAPELETALRLARLAIDPSPKMGKEPAQIPESTRRARLFR